MVPASVQDIDAMLVANEFILIIGQFYSVNILTSAFETGRSDVFKRDELNVTFINIYCKRNEQLISRVT